ncbi:MAG: FAD-dependent monooxygenase [Alphaproteobacteria bacterium]|nr:FAD-dependent monooxygenase [Alphaproteobacteria bacterium]
MASSIQDTLFIAGAGIGGLTAAIALSRRARPVTVLEAAPALDPIGSGLQLSPNALHVLRGLGLEEAVRRHAVAPEAIRVMSARTGRPIAEIPLGQIAEARYGAPYLVIHRGDLQQVLLNAAKASAGIDLRLGTRVRHARQNADAVQVEIETEKGNDHLSGEALVGADGVWSNVRRRVMDLRQAVFSGRTAYRAVVPVDRVPARWRETSGLWLSRRAHVVHYPVSGESSSTSSRSLPRTGRRKLVHAGRHERPARPLRLLAERMPEPALLPDGYLKWALCGMDPAPAGSTAVSRCWATPLTPCCPSPRKGPACLSRMPTRSPVPSTRPTIFPMRSPAIRPNGRTGPRACCIWREPMTGSITCPARWRSRATPS